MGQRIPEKEIAKFKFVTSKYIILTNKDNIFIIIPKLIKSLSRHG